MPSGRTDVVEEETVVAVEGVDEDAEAKHHPKLLQNPDTKGPSTQIFQLETGMGVVCTSNMAVLHTFVQNLQLVPGRTFTFRNLKNENLTSSANLN